MAKKKMFLLFRNLLIPCVILLVLALGAGKVTGRTPAGAGYADIVYIDLPHVSGKAEMSGVSFRHDKHVAAIADENSCKKCHLQNKGRFVWKFKRLKDGDSARDMQIYHDNCVACHIQYKKAGKKSGPPEANCRACHSRKKLKNSLWVELDFDKALHWRHVRFASENLGKGKECGACHHLYDKEKKHTVYVRGREDNCRYCHKSKEQNETSSLRKAAHNSCVVCHQRLKVKGVQAGPVECKSCHSAGGQRKIKKIENLERLKRKQPDIVLMASWAREKDADSKLDAQHVKAVWFDHKLHENKTAKCISCHHKSMQKCASCHGAAAADKGGAVSLETAMHSASSGRSCLGCHSAKMKDPSCGACHWMQPELKRKNDCVKCHSVKHEKLKNLLRDKTNRENLTVESIERSLPTNDQGAEDLKIPEKVTIGAMSDKYEAVEFPHRKIFEAIKDRIKDNRLAGFFHGTQMTLCIGCHHNSPKSENPPKCIACHQVGKSRALTGRPSLKGAYHGQCITCHQKMDIKSPAATECLKCHQQRRTSNQIQTEKS